MPSCGTRTYRTLPTRGALLISAARLPGARARNRTARQPSSPLLNLLNLLGAIWPFDQLGGRYLEKYLWPHKQDVTSVLA